MNICAHLPGMDEQVLRAMEWEKDIGFCCPPHPDQPDFDDQFQSSEQCLMRSCQIHTCHANLCLCEDWNTCQIMCKCCTPWPLSEVTMVEGNRNWMLQWSYGYINNYNPQLLVFLWCNHDIKLLTNGEDTKNVCWYITKYAMKAQSKLANASALLAQRLAYHFVEDSHTNGILDCNCKLVFRCLNVLNRDVEQSAPQVISYLMGWGDTFKSHHYVPLYWTSFLPKVTMHIPRVVGHTMVHALGINIDFGCLRGSL